MFTLTPPPIAMTRAELDARIRYLAREAERAESRGLWLEAEDLRGAADACRDQLAERSAWEPEALARHLDAYNCDRDAVLASVYERR